MDGTQLVSDHLTNRRVASGKKREARVIESADNTIIAVLFPDRKRGEQPGTLSEMVRCSDRSEEHTSELQSRGHLVCRLLLEKKKKHVTRRASTAETQPYV